MSKARGAIMTRLNMIKTRIANAPRGPWTVEEGEEADSVRRPNGLSLTWDDHDGEVFSPDTAQLVAHAPEDLEALVSVVEKIQELHIPNLGHNPECECGIEAGAGARCVVCYEAYPCATIRVIQETL